MTMDKTVAYNGINRVHPWQEGYATLYIFTAWGRSFIAFAKPQKCLELCPRHFLVFTQALAFPVGYNRSYITLGRDVSHTYNKLPWQWACYW